MTAVSAGTLSRPLFRQALWRALVAASFVLSVTACSDGYPTEDVPQISPSEMTQAQLLTELNALGHAPNLNKRWRYVLHDDCELEVVVRNGDIDRRRLVLEGAWVDTRSADGVTEIVLVPKIGGAIKAVTVLETRQWIDTVKAQSLLTHLEMRCNAPVDAGT